MCLENRRSSRIRSIRLVNRIGLVEGIKDPKRVEMALWKLIPPEEGSDFCHRLVYHGVKSVRRGPKPYCDKVLSAGYLREGRRGVESLKSHEKQMQIGKG